MRSLETIVEESLDEYWDDVITEPEDTVDFFVGVVAYRANEPVGTIRDEVEKQVSDRKT